MDERYNVSISVRNLVEFVMRSGDIGTSFISSSRAVEGTRGHQKVQSEGGENYVSEVYINHTIEINDINFDVNGRIDGIIREADNAIVDEIKTTSMELENILEDYNERHWAQARCYGYMYAEKEGLQGVTIRLTYYNINSGLTKHFDRFYVMKELKAFFHSLLTEYAQWSELIIKNQRDRNVSIRNLDFPFLTYRKGQRDLSVVVYKTIRDENKLFAQAPTGTGKTASVLFPALKAMGEGLTSKIFYLTARTTTRRVAENTLDIMREKGLKVKSIILTAKEKICFCKESDCGPEECEFARGHFERVNAALKDILIEDSFTREKIEEYALVHKVCPFEFSLDISNFCDVIICDYNYVFDPEASLKRFFMESRTDYILLVDEAHNLVDRGMEMFSAQLYKRAFLQIKRDFKGVSASLHKCAGEINQYFISLNKRLEGEKSVQGKEPPLELYKLIQDFAEAAEEELSKNPVGEMWVNLRESYFESLSFIKISELYDENYITYGEKDGRDIKLKLLCLEPSRILKKIMDKMRAVILFSATLTPIDYYRELLGGDEGSYKIKLPSPFPKSNLCVLLDPNVSTRYVNREQSYERVAEDIENFLVKKGNYLVFFPSYSYMKEVYTKFIDRNPNVDTIVQSQDMKDEERDDFIGTFNSDNENTLVGFAVMGGVFGEGIDLTGDRLIGAVIVGVGLPQVNVERDILKNHFESTRGKGFQYAYIYPGMNRVMQAVGRVIRSENDRGAVLLIDDRFSNKVYRDLFPGEWMPINKINRVEDIRRFLEDFWGTCN